MKIKSIHINQIYTGYSRNDRSKVEAPCLLCEKTSTRFSVLQCTNRSVLVPEGDKMTWYPKNTALLYPENTLQFIRLSEKDSLGIANLQWIYMDILINDYYSLGDVFDFPVALPPDISKTVNREFRSLIFAAKQDKSLCDRKIHGYTILKAVLSCAKQKTLLNKNILQAIRYIKKHYKDNLSVQLLADRVGMSESNFYKLFKKQTGNSPVAYINNHRLLLASAMLEESDKPLNAIAEMVGFNGQYYFSRQFKEKFGMPPSAYRKLNTTRK